MSDFRLMYDSEFLYAFHLMGKEHTLRIQNVKAGELTGEGGRKTKKPIVYFEGKKLGLGMCKTNARTVAGMYGNDTREWVGKCITMFPTTTTFGRDTVDCIRIRPNVPTTAPAPTTQREPGSQDHD